MSGGHTKSSRLRRFFYNRTATAGLVIVLGVLAVSLAAPILGLPNPDTTSLADRLLPPGSEGHFLGTDELGRDMLSRLIWGTRVSLAVGLSATAIAAIIGSLIGIVSAFYGGLLDNSLMRGVDMLMAFPYLLLALAIVAVLGPGLFNALIAISIVNIPFFARNVRGATVGLVRLEYVDAARLSGLGDTKILLGQLLPNVLPVIFITISTTVGWMILETAGLSFLGLGAQPPQADLGSMLGNGRRLILTAPHVATLPGLVILILVIGINLVGDGLRDVLDPYLSSGALVSPRAATEIDRSLASHLRTPRHSTDSAAAAGHEADGTYTATEGTLLSIGNLKTWFWTGGEPVHATDGVSLEIPRGTAVGVMGESGSGKSVTALSVLGLVPTPPGRIVDGTVRYNGEELLGISLEELQYFRGNRISYVFQNPMTALNPLMPVGEQIGESIRKHQHATHAQARARAVELMTTVRIPDARHRVDAYPHELSGGMRQRVVIAMALANDPDLIIADEPTTALDVTIQAQILQLFNDLRLTRGVSLLFISHDFGVLSQICERVIVMYAGEVVEYGRVAEIYRAPLHPYTRRLMACVPRVGERTREMDAIPGLPPALDHLPRGCRFADRCDMVIDACRTRAVPLFPIGEREVRCIRTDAAAGAGGTGDQTAAGAGGTGDQTAAAGTTERDTP
ncbi:MAG: dipeptide/oligopeptide/nickel ABC transporter permease/ATP-binding protein [Spirochaetaceae bacterium]